MEHDLDIVTLSCKRCGVRREDWSSSECRFSRGGPIPVYTLKMNPVLDMGKVLKTFRETIARRIAADFMLLGGQRLCGCGKHPITCHGDPYAEHRTWLTTGHIPDEGHYGSHFILGATMAGSLEPYPIAVDEQWGEEFEIWHRCGEGTKHDGD